MSCLPNADMISDQLLAQGFTNVTVHAFEQLDSTSVWLGEHAAELSASDDRVAGVRGQHLCITDWQSAGVGRRGKHWQARAGNLMLSLLSYSDRPARELIGLSLVTGIAVAECLQDVVGVDVRLKWPNDLILKDAKLGGLITELGAAPSRHLGSEGTQLLTGVGINLLHDEQLGGLGIGGTSLETVGASCSRQDRDLLAARLVAAVLGAHQGFEVAGWSAFASRWVTLDWLRDKEVLIHHEKTTEQALARGVNEQGALLVERAGKITPVYSGNVSIRPTA